MTLRIKPPPRITTARGCVLIGGVPYGTHSLSVPVEELPQETVPVRLAVDESSHRVLLVEIDGEVYVGRLDGVLR